MVFSKEGDGLPSSLLDMEQVDSERGKPVGSEIKSVLGGKLPAFALAYGTLLRKDSSEVEQQELSSGSRTELQEHIEQLETLRIVLQEYSVNPSDFSPTVNKVSRDDDSCTVRLKKVEDGLFGEGEENAQTQLSLFTKGMTIEGWDETAKALALRGKDPHSTSEKIAREQQTGIIQINTVKVFRDPDTDRVSLKPQAGIRLSISGNNVRIQGVKYVGSQPHVFDLGKSAGFGSPEFSRLQAHIKRLAGFRENIH